MLIHRTCGGTIVVDNGRYPVVAGDVHYFIKCEKCGEKLGTLPGVENTQTRYEGSQLAAESAYKKQQRDRTN